MLLPIYDGDHDGLHILRRVSDWYGDTSPVPLVWKVTTTPRTCSTAVRCRSGHSRRPEQPGKYGNRWARVDRKKSVGDIIVGTVSSGATATLQELARENNDSHRCTSRCQRPHRCDVQRVFIPHQSQQLQDAVNICEYLTQEYETFVQIAPITALAMVAHRRSGDAHAVWR